MLIKMLFEMLIEMLIDDLMRFVKVAFDVENASNALTNFRCCQKTASDAETIKCIDRFASFCQKTASDSETIRCIDGFSIMPKKLHSDDRVHWRIGGFVKKLHLTMKRSGALTGFRYDLAVSVTNVVARFWLFDDASRQTSRQTNQTVDKQTERNIKWSDVCWLLKQASWFAKKWWKTTIQSWHCYGTCWIDCQQNNWSWRFYDTCQKFWKKKSKTMIQLSTKQLIVTFLWNVSTEMKKEKKITNQFDYRINKKVFQFVTSSVDFIRRCL